MAEFDDLSAHGVQGELLRYNPREVRFTRTVYYASGGSASHEVSVALPADAPAAEVEALVDRFLALFGNSRPSTV